MTCHAHAHCTCQLFLASACQGTLFNFLVIGGLLIAVLELDFMGELPPQPVTNGSTTHYDLAYTLQPVEIFTFSSIISAVDPVAVLGRSLLCCLVK